MNPAQTTTDIDETLKDLYKNWPDLKRFMKSIGCPSNDAEDLFQESLLIYIRKLKDPSFTLSVEPYYYIKNTCKFLWYNQARKEGKNPKIELPENVADYENDWFNREMKLQRIEKAIDQIGKQCQQLLKMFYGLGQNMVDIAEKLGFRNDNVAKAQKYRCVNKVKDIVRSQESLSH